MHVRRWKSVATFAAATTVLAVFASGAQARPEAGAGTSAEAAYKVGIIYSRGPARRLRSRVPPGPAPGMRTNQGTNRSTATRSSDLVDDAGDPAKAVTAAKDLIGQGYKIIAGATSSGVGLQVAPIAAQNKVLFISGPAATDGITGVNHYTFRSGRQTYQDVLAARRSSAGVGKKVIVFAQDYAFGQGNVAAVKRSLGGRGAHGQPGARAVVGAGLHPVRAAGQAGEPGPALRRLGGHDRPGHVAGARPAGRARSTTVVTGLAERATWPTFGDGRHEDHFLSHYVSTAPHNKVNDCSSTRCGSATRCPTSSRPTASSRPDDRARAPEGRRQ